MVAAVRNVLATLAVKVCEAAVQGRIDEDDAGAIYEVYILHASGVSKVDHTLPSVRVQVSKLRQIIKLGVTCGRKGCELLSEVRATHDKLTRYEVVKTKALYDCFIDAARLSVARQCKPIPKATLIRICTHHSSRNP